MSPPGTTSTERLDLEGEHLIGKIKEVIHEGNVQRIVVNDANRKPVLDLPRVCQSDRSATRSPSPGNSDHGLRGDGGC
jgi:hypothetical protein